MTSAEACSARPVVKKPCADAARGDAGVMAHAFSLHADRGARQRQAKPRPRRSDRSRQLRPTLELGATREASLRRGRASEAGRVLDELIWRGASRRRGGELIALSPPPPPPSPNPRRPMSTGQRPLPPPAPGSGRLGEASQVRDRRCWAVKASPVFVSRIAGAPAASPPAEVTSFGAPRRTRAAALHPRPARRATRGRRPRDR